jgi:FAD-dependent halogenase
MGAKAARDPWDAIVIGGGPAGSGAATYLAREGRRVLLLERERFPRAHVGESLLPGVLPYLDALGVRDVIEGAGFERKEGQTFVWGRDREPWRIDFRELDVHPYAYFVDRARFDQLLLAHAARSGARVEEERTVTRVLFEKGRAVGVTYKDAAGETREARARFVIDASGPSALVARGAGLRRMVRGLRNVALWSYWKGAARLPGDQRAHILTASIPEGWVWVIPLGERTSVGVVTSSATRAARDERGPTAWYEAALRACAPAAALLEGAERVEKVTAARDWSYRARRLSGPGILLAGDAACFIDPILSTGVHLAMSAAYWAAACVHSALGEPRHEPFFRRFYDETYGAMYRELLVQVKAFYRTEGRRDSVYWTSKKLLRAGNAVPPDLSFLFITSGLLRNAALAAPHDALGQARAELGSRVDGPRGAGPKGAELPVLGARPRARSVSPPLVWRVGGEGSAELVTLKADGMRLYVARHEPRGLLDRPRGSAVALELSEGKLPLALALIEERRRSPSPALPAGSGGRLALSLLPYPLRPCDPARLAAVQEALRRLIEAADDGSAKVRLRRVRVRLRRLARSPGALPEGLHIARSREHLYGGGSELPTKDTFESP